MRHREESGLAARILRCSTVYGEHQRPDRGQGVVVDLPPPHRSRELPSRSTATAARSATTSTPATSPARRGAARPARRPADPQRRRGNRDGADRGAAPGREGGRPRCRRSSSTRRGASKCAGRARHSRLRGLIEFEPTPLAAGIARTHAWLRDSRRRRAGRRPKADDSAAPVETWRRWAPPLRWRPRRPGTVAAGGGEAGQILLAPRTPRGVPGLPRSRNRAPARADHGQRLGPVPRGGRLPDRHMRSMTSLLGRARLGIPRPDVAQLREQPRACTAGFELTADLGQWGGRDGIGDAARDGRPAPRARSTSWSRSRSRSAPATGTERTRRR